MPSTPLSPLKVLVVEDEALLAIDLQQALEEAGHQVIGPALSLAEALALEAATPCDAAITDVSLGDDTSEPLARQLAARRAPLIVVSGFSERQLPAGFAGATRLSKPIDMPALLTILERLKTQVRA